MDSTQLAILDTFSFVQATIAGFWVRHGPLIFRDMINQNLLTEARPDTFVHFHIDQ